MCKCSAEQGWTTRSSSVLLVFQKYVIMNGEKNNILFISVSVLTVRCLNTFFFSHKHITSLLLPSSVCTVFVCDLTSGWAGSSGKQNKAIWFLRPYTAPTPNNRPGETTLSQSHSQHYSLLILALCLSLVGKNLPVMDLSKNIPLI